ncbi:MAG: methylated-DNA--[protein]-cysteine S-methyltransferase [Actinomycetota bacterium]|nr:methylated-DNA--[protein]-cysteine S-methyltransferase [Actinomycetota bacterium]
MEAQLERLGERLTTTAERAGVLDLAYGTVSTPIGELMLVASTRGVVRLAFEIEDHDAVLAGLAATLSPRILHAPERLDRAVRELEEYFAGERRSFDVAVDLSLSRGFRGEVQAYLSSIEFGRTLSYAQVAEAVGNPRAVRAVGSACASNPVPLFVPCHRVVRSDGSFGAYRGGHDAKGYLLAMEAAA